MKRKVLALLLGMALAVGTLTGCGSAPADAPVEQTETDTAAEEKSETTEEPVAEAPKAEDDTTATIGNSDAATTIRFAWWGNQVRNDRTVEMLNLYTQQNPDVTFEVEFIEWGSYWEKLATEAAAGELPDIIQMDYSYLLQYQQKNLLAGLNEYVDSGVIDLSDCNESTINSGRIDG